MSGCSASAKRHQVVEVLVVSWPARRKVCGAGGPGRDGKVRGSGTEPNDGKIRRPLRSVLQEKQRSAP